MSKIRLKKINLKNVKSFCIPKKFMNKKSLAPFQIRFGLFAYAELTLFIV